MNHLITRRRFAVDAAALALASSALGKVLAAQSPSVMTAAEVVEQIKQHLNLTWDNKSYRDTFKAGDPATPVHGIACCFMSTFDVIKRAQAKGLNFVSTHEPTCTCRSCTSWRRTAWWSGAFTITGIAFSRSR